MATPTEIMGGDGFALGGHEAQALSLLDAGFEG